MTTYDFTAPLWRWSDEGDDAETLPETPSRRDEPRRDASPQRITTMAGAGAWSVLFAAAVGLSLGGLGIAALGIVLL